jgi:hypothetical protein
MFELYIYIYIYMYVPVMEVLSGVTVPVVDPYEEEIAVLPYQGIQAHQEAVIAAAEAVVQKHLVDKQ